MTVQRMTWTCFAIAIVGLLIPTASAEQNLPSRAALEAMGLADLEVLSDDQAISIRGQGFKESGGDTWITADGKSWASGGSGHKRGVSIDYYHVVADHVAYGRNKSSAGKSSKKSGHGGKKGGGKKGGGNGNNPPSANSNSEQGWGGSDSSGKHGGGGKQASAKSNSGGKNHGGRSKGGGGYGGSKNGGGKHSGGHGGSVKVRAGGYSRASL